MIQQPRLAFSELRCRISRSKVKKESPPSLFPVRPIQLTGPHTATSFLFFSSLLSSHFSPASRLLNVTFGTNFVRHTHALFQFWSITWLAIRSSALFLKVSMRVPGRLPLAVMASLQLAAAAASAKRGTPVPDILCDDHEFLRMLYILSPLLPSLLVHTIDQMQSSPLQA